MSTVEEKGVTMMDTTTSNGVAQGFYAVKVRVAGEGQVAETLKGKGFDVMMPVIETRRQYTDRVKRSYRALFPGYMFVQMSERDMLSLISTPGVGYLVKTGSHLTPLSEEELANIKILCKGSFDLKECSPISIGQKVTVNSGPLTGLTGVLVRTEGSTRVVLSMNSIFQSVSIEVSETKLNIVSNASRRCENGDVH
jgi:transcription antitermination factor NusG